MHFLKIKPVYNVLVFVVVVFYEHAPEKGDSVQSIIRKTFFGIRYLRSQRNNEISLAFKLSTEHANEHTRRDLSCSFYPLFIHWLILFSIRESSSSLREK